MKSYCQKIIKPWGYEIIYTPPDYSFVGKLAFTRKGHRWSFQYHEEKEETICLISGSAEIWLEWPKNKIRKLKMEKYRGYFIARNQKHRFCAKTNCWTVETSTAERGKTVRIDDDYDRPTETDKMRKLVNRGWGRTK